MKEPFSQFTISEKAIHLGFDNLENTHLHVDEFEFGDDFNLDKIIAMSSPLGNGAGSVEMERTSSDGRSMGTFVDGGFKDKKGRKYCELLVKGVGVSREVNIPSIKDACYKDSGKQVLSPASGFGRAYPLRYSTKDIDYISGKFGFAAPQQEVEYEQKVGEKLAHLGFRTRKLVLSGAFSERVILMTDDGPKKPSEISSKLGYAPGIEIWAMRSRYRLQDLMADDIFKYASLFTKINRRNWNTADKLSNNVSFYSKVKKDLGLKEDVLVSAKKNLSILAKEIIERSALDEDERFVALSNVYKDIEMQSLSSDFWIHYTRVFSRILGEQVGIMYSAGAFTKKDLLNSQNVTLMAEIVDHDVTYFDINAKKDWDVVARQLRYTLEHLSILLVSFYAMEILHENTNVEDLIMGYLDGVISVLNDTDKRMLMDTLKIYCEKNNLHFHERKDSNSAPMIDVASIDSILFSLVNLIEISL